MCYRKARRRAASSVNGRMTGSLVRAGAQDALTQESAAKWETRLVDQSTYHGNEEPLDGTEE
jgi:hypothetical protein